MFFKWGDKMVDEKVLYNEVTKILIKFKVPLNILGFDILRMAIMKCFYEESFLENITTKLYPYLAEKFDTSRLHIERNIRNAIDKAYEAKGLLTINEYCMEVVYRNNYKFTNSEMISSIVKILSLKVKKEEFLKQKRFVANN